MHSEQPLEHWIQLFQDRPFVFADTHWWPLIKIQVSYQWYLFQQPSDSRKPYIQLSNGQFPTPKKTRKSLISSLKERLQKKATTSAVLILTDHKNQTTAWEGHVVNAYTQPFEQYFSEQQIAYDLFDISKPQDFKPFHDSNLYPNFQGEVMADFNADTEFQSSLQTACRSLKELLHPDFDLYGFLATQIVNNQARYLYFVRLFKSCSYQKVLLYCYYNNFMMAATRAAHDCDIEVIEYQHSQITSGHFAYSAWSNRIVDSAKFFPNIFWAWRQSDVNFIQKSYQFIPGFRAIVGGHVFLSRTIPIVEKKEQSILLTLQGQGIPEFLAQRIANENDWKWYLRVHPRYPQDQSLIEELKKQNPDFVEIDEANQSSIYTLMPRMNFHVTAYSGSALEASYFGVQNLIFGAKGAQTYQTEIQSGEYLWVNSSDDLNQALSSKGQKSQISFPDRAMIQKNIRQYF